MSLVSQFLAQIRDFVRAQNGGGLRAWLQVEPGADQQYHDMGRELRAAFRRPGTIDKALEASLPLDDDDDDDDGGRAAVWPGLLAFIKDYLVFWRDVDPADLLAAHELLSGLVK